MFIVFNSIIPFLDIYTREIFMYVNREAYSRVFMSVVIIVKSKSDRSHYCAYITKPNFSAYSRPGFSQL